MNGMERPASRISGFTLIELMVVVAIIAIVSAAVIPAFSSSMHKNRQREAAMLIVEGVFMARSRAARTGRCHRVRVIPSPAANDGGFGGAVAVDESTQHASCTMAITPPPPPPDPMWRRVSYKSVWTSTEAANDIQAEAQGDSHAGLVGEDVAILRVTSRAGNVMAPGPIHFEPTGWLAIQDRDERWFDIAGGAVTRQVQLTAGGSVRYTLRPQP